MTENVKRIHWKRWVIIALAVVAAVYLIRSMGFSVSAIEPQQIRTQILAYGWLGPLVFLAVFGQPFVPFPGSVFALAAGLVYGPWVGLALALLGATIRAAGGYGIGKWLGQSFIEKLLHKHSQGIHALLKNKGFKSVLILRLVPNFPFDAQNYVLGSSGVSFLPYLIATTLGIIPWVFCFVLIGNSVMDAEDLKKAFGIMLLITTGVIVKVLWNQRVKQKAIAK